MGRSTTSHRSTGSTAPTAPTDLAVTHVRTIDLTDAAATAPPARRRVDRGVLIYRLVVVVAAGFLLSGPGGLLSLGSPWADATSAAHAEHALELHRWHATEIAAMISLVISATLVASAWRPRTQWVLTQSALIGIALFGLVAFTLPSPVEVLLPVTAVFALVAVASPARRSLVRLAPAGRRRPLAVAIAVAATPFLLLTVWQNLSLQISGGGEHAELGHWAVAAVLAATLSLLTWLAIRDSDGARTLSAVLAVSYLYLGVAALVLPRHDGSWSTLGGVIALTLGAACLVSIRGPRARSSRGARA